MSAPSHVPNRPNQPKSYSSPRRRGGSWRANRPGDVVGAAQPRGSALGNPGPDQGYVLKLANDFRDDLVLAPGEHAADAIEGACAVALRRASLYGRAPMRGDLEIAFAIYGYLGEAPADLVAHRRERFDEIHHSTIHYFAARELADSVPEATLRMSPAEVEAACAANWKAPLGLS
ncbi:MAG: hypothetical protein AAF548_08260 [Actinomycetota bacterium]